MSTQRTVDLGELEVYTNQFIMNRKCYILGYVIHFSNV